VYWFQTSAPSFTNAYASGVRAGLLWLTVAAALLGAGAAGAAIPTEAQRVAVLRALPASWHRIPARCVGFEVRVDGSGRFASVAMR